MAEKVRVLYVDDEIDLLELGKIFLEAPGEISIETIDSAPSTLSFLERASFDAIISDYQMPGMDGITFLKAVRSKENYIPFIIFTGKGREEVVIDALNAGADFYIQKGGDPTSQFAELSHKVKRAVDQHRADTALRESEERFRFVMHYFPGVLWTVDRDLRFTLYQGSGLVSMGLTPDLVVGMSLFDFYKIADPKQIAISAHTRALQGETVVYEYDLLGHTFWTTVSPIRDHKGNITGAEGIALEITEQRRAEEAFQQANTRLNLLSSIAPTKSSTSSPLCRAISISPKANLTQSISGSYSS
jgi:PAS domain S-box-containing protein